MSKIRYTQDGDYDRSQDITVNVKRIGPIFSFTPNYFSEFFYAFGENGPSFPPINPSTDGVYADLSDNSRDVLLEGGDRGDVLIGGPANDTINGRPGNDRIVGGFGRDQVTGGDGSDTFVFLTVSDFSVGPLDQIVDYKAVSQGDRLDLTAIADFTYIGSSGFHADGTAELRAKQTGKGFTVFGDVDGDGLVDFKLKVLTGEPLLRFEEANAPHALTPEHAHTAYAPMREPLHAIDHLALA